MNSQTTKKVRSDFSTREGRKEYMGQFLPILPKYAYAEIAKETGDSEIFVRKFFGGEFKITPDHRVLIAVSRVADREKKRRQQELQELSEVAHNINESASKHKRKALMGKK